MDKQKAVPPVTQKITRKLASESSDHKDVMNYYSTISRDETGAPVRWKMNSMHEEVVPGRGSPALAKIARSRSNSRDSSSERKKTDSENSQSKLSSSGKKGPVKKTQDSVNSVESEGTGKDSSIDDIATTNKNLINEKRKTEKSNDSLAQESKVKKKGRAKSESFMHIKELQKQSVKHVVTKNKKVDKAETVVKKKRGRPKSLDFMNSESMETVANGEDDYFKSPHPLTPCNILVKPKKGRPKETPPTLEPEPSVSPNAPSNADTISGDETQNEKQEYKRKAGPGRPAKKRKISSEVTQMSDLTSEITLKTEIDRKPKKVKSVNRKLADKTQMIGKRKPVLPLKAKTMIFKSKNNLNVKKSEKNQAIEGQIKRKGGRPPGSKNKPKPVAVLIKESKLRRSSTDSETNLETRYTLEPSTNEVESINEDHVSDYTISGISETSSIPVNDVSAIESKYKIVIKEKLSSKNIKTKDPLRKGLVSKGKVNPKSKALKTEKSVPVVKRKKILAAYAKKHTDSSIASLPGNDLRRILYNKLKTKVNINEKGSTKNVAEKKVDEKEEDNIALSELQKQSPHVADDRDDETSTSDIQLSKSTSEVQNLSAMVESKRYTKTEKDQNTELVRKKGRPKKSIIDVKESGKASDNESTCSEISSFSSVSNNSIRKHSQDTNSAIKSEEMAVTELTKVKKKPGRKRKQILNDELIDRKSDLEAKEHKLVPKSGIIYDFEADDATNNDMKTTIEIIKKRKSIPKILKPDGTSKTNIKTAFKSTIEQTVRPQMNEDVLKHLNKVKNAKDIKSEVLKPELSKLERKKEFYISANVNAQDSKKLDGEVKDELKVSGKDAEIKSDIDVSNCYSEVKLSVPLYSGKTSDDQVSDKDSISVDYDKNKINFEKNETEINKDEKKCSLNQVVNYSVIQSVKIDNKEKSHVSCNNENDKKEGLLLAQEATCDIEDKIYLTNDKDMVTNKIEECSSAMNILMNNDKLHAEVKEKDILLASPQPNTSQNSEENVENEQIDSEKINFEFDSKSIMDRAKAISFEVTEKKRLLKEKILKGREFNKSFIYKAVDVNDEVDEGEMVLPDNDIDTEKGSSYSNKTEELNVEIDKEEKFLSDDGTDEITFFEDESTESADEIVEEIIKSMIDQVCKQVSIYSPPDSIKTDNLKDNSIVTSLSYSADEKNIREYLGNIPDSVQSMKTFNVGKGDSQNVTFKVRKPITKTEPVKWRKRVRKREKKSTKEIETPVVRKIGLRQKISRSPLDNIALRQSIEENEYIKEQMKKTKRGPKPKLKQSPTLEPEEVLATSKLLEQSNSITENLDVSENTETSVCLEEISPVPAVTIEDLRKECKPCSVILKDFLKQLQMKNTMDSLDVSQEASQVREEEETEKNPLTSEDNVKTTEKEKSDSCAAIELDQEAVSEVNQIEERNGSKKDPELISCENKEVESMSKDKKSPQKDKLISLDTEEEKSVSKDTINVEQNRKPITESMNKELDQKRRGKRTVKGLRNASGLNLPRRSLRPREVSPKAVSEINKEDTTKDKLRDQTVSEISDIAMRKHKLVSVETSEQTARKTVPPLKIKLQGGLTSKTKVYTVETAVNANPSSVDSALDKKPKKKFKSKSKSDSESEKSEKRKSHHHHAKKVTKSPDKSQESDSVKHSEKKIVETQKTETLKVHDAYEANFLAFIQQQEKEDSVNMANWRNPIVSKASHQLVGGKACKSGDDGTLTVSACALAETKTSSIGSDKFVTLSKSSVPSTTENNVQNGQIEQSKTSVCDESVTEKSDLEHFQQTEKAVSNLASKVPTNKQFFCNHCEFLCETQNEIMEHIKSLHKDQLLYSCTICHKVTFKTKPAILAHFATYHQGMKDSYICLPDYYEKQIDPKPVKSPTDQPDNIFDRMSNLFDIQSSKAEASKTVTNSQAESVGPSKTAAEADSTTKLDEGEDQLSSKAISVDEDSDEEMTSAEVQDQKAVEEEATPVEESETTDKADTTEEPDNEMNIKIVDVVSLKDQGAFNMENCASESMVPEPPENTLSSSETIKPSELKIPFYPAKVVTTLSSASAKVIQAKKPSGKTGTTYKCETCQVHAPVLAALVAHLKSSHTNIPKLFQCPYCRDMEGETEALIHQHIRRCHPTDNPNPPVALSEPAKRNLKTLTVELPEKAENTIVERDIYMCLRCKKHFPSLEMTYNHLELQHREVFVYVCPFCKVFKAKEEFIVNTHVLNFHQRSIEDINISLAIDGTQFVRVCSLIKDKGMRTGTKTTPSSSQAVRPQVEPRASPKQPVPNLTIPFNQNMAPLNQALVQLNTALRQTIPQIPQNVNPQQAPPVRPVQLQGAKKRKATLSESIAQLTLQRQLQQAQEDATKLQTTHANQPGARPSMQQPPPLLRGPPPLIRYDQLTKVPASLVAAQHYLQTGKANNTTTNNQMVTSNILGQLTISAAERLQTLNNPRSQPTQIQTAARPIQSALFDTSDPNSFIPVTRKQPGPVLNIPQISRTAVRQPSQQDSQPMQRNLITGSPLDLSNKSTPEPSPPADSKADETNPEAFKIFNIQPSAPMPQANIMPQFVRPDTTSTIAYRPTTPHVANVPISAVNMVPITLGNISLQQMQNLPQFVRMNFPQALQQVVTSQSLQQIVIPQSLQQVLPTQSVQQVVIPQSLQQVLSPQTLQQVIAPQSLQYVAQANVTQASTPQSVVTASSTPQTSTSQVTSQAAASEPDSQPNTTEVPKNKEAPSPPMFKCPYCPEVVKLKLEEVKPHIEEKHPGSQVLLMPLLQ